MTVYHQREIETPAHPRHCKDSSEVKSWHFSPAGAGDTNEWCITHLLRMDLPIIINGKSPMSFFGASGEILNFYLFFYEIPLSTEQTQNLELYSMRPSARLQSSYSIVGSPYNAKQVSLNHNKIICKMEQANHLEGSITNYYAYN